MFFYEIAPADRSYGGKQLLTYRHESNLIPGQIVVVKIRNKSISGFVTKKVPKPNFPTKLIEFIYEGSTLNQTQLKFFALVNEYYPGTLGATASMFVPNLLKKHQSNEKNKLKSVVIKNNTLPKLTNQQELIFKKIISSKIRTHIVHGDTGTGKTRLYLELAKEMHKKNMSFLIITPEISLTPQLAEQFKDIFKKVFVIHSELTVKEKREIWVEINDTTDPIVVIGARSSLFSPINNLGMVVIDEFHDHALKQDQSPKYQTNRLAAILSKISDCKLVLGSATPPVEDYFYATKTGSEVHRLSEKPNGDQTKKTIKAVRLGSPSERTSYDLISKSLLASIEDKLNRGEQVLVFLNKRGSSRTILCESCGWTISCDRCNIPYIYHADKHTLVCHTCSKKTGAVNNCPKCGSKDIIFKNPGTKAIEASLSKVFPKAKIGRYDKDNTKDETFSNNYEDIKLGNIDILVGTQILTKGHDLPKLTLVAILLAEAGLQFPDFSAEESNFQLLHQVIGRVGRTHLDGDVLIQTLNEPKTIIKKTEHKINNWEDFYRNELKNRKKFKYPPFCYMLKIELSKNSQDKVFKQSSRLVDKLIAEFPSLEIIGPSPALIERKNDRWYMHIVVKSVKRSDLTNVIFSLPSDCSYDLDPINLL